MVDKRIAAASAPGKLILFGEHAVLYGAPALGASLSRTVRVSLQAGTGRVELRLGDGLTEPLGAEQAAQPTELVRAALGADADRLDATIELGVPPCSGLGSSAALAVATLRAHHAYANTSIDDATLLARAIDVESVAHGRSSGLDPAISARGGLVRFARSGAGDALRLDVRGVEVPASFHLVVGALGTHGGTRTSVNHLAELSTRPEIAAALECLGAVSRAAEAALVEGALDRLGSAADLAHGVLSGLGLVSDRVETVVRALRAAGALGAKMSGAGGAGGAFFALAPDIRGAVALAAVAEARGAMSWVETVS